jgi:hypothetical protein
MICQVGTKKLTLRPIYVWAWSYGKIQAENNLLERLPVEGGVE